jgi:hypothetical protein
MPTAASVMEFIIRNNAFAEEIEDLLDEATNDELKRAKKDRALATAGHLACRRLRRLHDAEAELWTPLRQQRPTLVIDDNLVLHHAPAGVPLTAPRVPINKELLQLFRHPDPQDAADIITQANQRLRAVVESPTGGVESLVNEAIQNVEVLATEICALIDKKGKHTWKIRVVRSSLGVFAGANLSAAATTLQQESWEAAPDLLRHVAELLQRAEYIDVLPLISLTAGAIVVVEAATAVKLARSVTGDGQVIDDTSDDHERRVNFARNVKSERKKIAAVEPADAGTDGLAVHKTRVALGKTPIVKASPEKDNTVVKASRDDPAAGEPIDPWRNRLDRGEDR